MSELSGRELDRAIAEALGVSTTRDIETGEPMCRHTFEIIPCYHESVDALREVEPEECAIDVQRRSDKRWLVKVFRIYPWEEVARASGTGEPEARARALLAWLKTVR